MLLMVNVLPQLFHYSICEYEGFFYNMGLTSRRDHNFCTNLQI